MKICIVTIDHGKPDLTSVLYSSITKQTQNNIEVHFVVLENSRKIGREKYSYLCDSSDRNISSELHFLENDGYFGTASNYLKNTNFDHFSWVIVCNNDLTLDVDFLSTLENQQANIAEKLLVCPGIIENGRNINPLSRAVYPNVKRNFWDFYYKHYFFAFCYEFIRIPISKLKFLVRSAFTNDSEIEGDIYLGYGAMFLISPLFINKMGGLPVKTFLYQEESVICGYARSFGNWPYFLPALRVHHESHSTLRYISFDKDYQFRRDAWWATRDIL